MTVCYGIDNIDIIRNKIDLTLHVNSIISPGSLASLFWYEEKVFLTNDYSLTYNIIPDL